jgi:beta-lactamase regulating signal transducer with metallopeptidase domain
MSFTTWLNAELFRVIGWTIIHSLWQCLGLLALLKVFLLFTPMRRSRLRYDVAIAVLGSAVLGGLCTLLWEYRVLDSAGVGAGLGRAVTAAVVTVGAGAVKAPLAGPLGWLGMLGRLSPWLAVGWLLGIAFFSGRLLYSGYELRRLRRLPGLPDGGASDLLARLRLKMGLPQTVRLIVTDKVSEPLTFGLLKAVVVLPLHYVTQVPAGQLELILAHELAHIRRRDYLMNLCQSVCDALFFFNPFFRVLSGIVRNEREYCCDDLATGVGGDGRLMAIALTNLKLMVRHPSLSLSAAPVRSGFYRRVSRLINPEERTVVSARGMLAGILGAAVLVLVLTQCSRSVVGQDAMTPAPESMEQVLTDNQAGYKEQVFYFKQAGTDHELFLVSTQEKQEPLYGYVDGMRVEKAGLDPFVVAIKRGRQMETIRFRVADAGESRSDSVAILYVMADSVEKAMKVKVAAGENVSELKRQLDEIDGRQVTAAMEQYKVTVRAIPLDVKQHEVLTRIIVNNAYSSADQAAVRELIRQRQAL